MYLTELDKGQQSQRRTYSKMTASSEVGSFHRPSYKSASKCKIIDKKKFQNVSGQVNAISLQCFKNKTKEKAVIFAKLQILSFVFQKLKVTNSLP